jgi:hypothetical protein
MSRGISDPTPPLNNSPEPSGDLPTIHEMDEAIKILFDMQSETNTKLQMLVDLIGASIASSTRRDAKSDKSENSYIKGL